MKYGAELSRRSVPEWRAYNLDYNEIKSVIKKATSPNAPPDAVDSVFDALYEQYEIIGLFVKSKTGEIDRRVAQCEKLVNAIAEQDSGEEEEEHALIAKDSRSKRKSRQSLVYRLRQETIRLSKDVQHLARFIGVQRTGFRKLLKKYKKWSSSTALSERFLPILEDPKSFTNQDFTSTVLELSLLNNVLRQAKLTNVTATPIPPLANERLCMFDCEMVTAVSNSAVFWVHPDNVVETKITLLHNLSLVSDVAPTTNPLQPSPSSANLAAYSGDGGGAAAANELTYTTYLDSKKFSSIQNNTDPGQLKSVRGAQTVLCSPVGGLRHFCIANLPPAHADMLLHSQFDALNAAIGDMDNLSKMAVAWVEKRHAIPIAKVESKRTRLRYTETANNSAADDSLPSSPNTVMDTPDIWATIDSNIKFTHEAAAQLDWPETPKDVVEFPHSVLEIRWKGLDKPTWVKDLESSHLVHPVKGFSLYAHSVAIYYPDALMALPKWLSLIEQGVDIRKTPKPPSTLKRNSSKSASLLSPNKAIPGQGILLNSASETETLLSGPDRSDYGSSSDEASRAANTAYDKPVVRYWNEFDDPEDGDPGIFVVIPSDESDEGLFDDDNVAYLLSLTERIASKVTAAKRKLLGWLGYKEPPRRTRGLSTIYEEPEEDDDDDGFEGYYQPRGKHHHHHHRDDEAAAYHHGDTPLYTTTTQQRNHILTVFYSICLFLSALMVSTLFGVILGEDMAGLNIGTYIFIIAGVAFALAISVLAMALFMMRSVIPGAWHQTLVFASFFAIVCAGVGELAWLFA